MSRQSANNPPIDPALAALDHIDQSQGAALLHSGRFHHTWASRSIFATPKAWFRYTLESGSQLFGLTRNLTGNLWTDLKGLLNDPELSGKWFGYISYDIARLIEPAKLTPSGTTDDRNWPIVELAYCPTPPEGVHQNIETFTPASGGAPGTPGRLAGSGGGEALKTPGSVDDSGGGGPTSVFTESAYQAAVMRVKDYIAAGDVFQVNLAQRFTSRFTGSPVELFKKLATVSPAWYGAYLQTPDGRAICSTSPELFLQVKNRNVITRPIKGTRPASVDPDQLRDSDKDKAELNMIVDLMRNDLGKVCQYNSINVTQPRTIETHPTVHHGVATITGVLHQAKDVVDLLRATLPGGSITGAPKIRAMQIIDELEPVSRGPYCGCIGYISRDELCLNIAIRTMLLVPQADGSYQLDFSVGGGIVADSDPAAEYQETLDKAQAILQALAGSP